MSTEDVPVRNATCVCGFRGHERAYEPCKKFVPMEPIDAGDCEECGHWEGCHVH